MSDRIIPFPFEELQRRRAERAGKLGEHPQTAAALLPSQAEENRPDTIAAHAAHPEPGSLLPDELISTLPGSEGQSPSWNMRLGSGLGMTCSRNPLFPDPEEEAARIIGRAIRYARKCARHQIPIPPGTLNALARLADAGNATALLLWEWLKLRGQIPPQRFPRPRLRLVAKQP